MWPVRELIEATNKALVEPLHRLALNEEVSFDLQTALEQNTFVFSGFKTHHELTEAAQLLKGDDGRFKPFNQFRTDIEALNQNYNGNYLRAEYNFATASTQMAAKWQQWAEDGDEYNLQYRTANDDRVREEHAALHGTTLPPSDPFWDSYLPPNGWNCRCTTVQVLKYKYPESDSARAIAAAAGITDTPKKQIFRFNPGKQMKVFPPKHPYLPKGCGNCGRTLLSYNPNSAQCRACSAINQNLSTSLLRNITAGNNKSVLRQYQAQEKQNAKSTPKYSNKSDQYYTKHVYCSHNDLEAVIAHAYTAEEVVAVRDLPNQLPSLRNGKYLPIDTSRGNYKDKIKRGVIHYTAYDVTINGESYELKCEVIKSDARPYVEERPYSMRKK